MSPYTTPTAATSIAAAEVFGALPCVELVRLSLNFCVSKVVAEAQIHGIQSRMGGLFVQAFIRFLGNADCR
jgi:hypothetical protein